MAPMSPEKDGVVKQFDSLCKKIIREESRNIKKEKLRYEERMTSIDDLSKAEKKRMFFYDQYFSDEIRIFKIIEYEVEIRDSRIAEALGGLASSKREIILLYFFLDMSDSEISETVKISRSTIQRRRKAALEEMRHRMMR